MKFSTLTLANLGVAAALLLTPFLVGLTASAPYDPWYDLDENGAIDIFDVVRIAGTYGTTGNPGRNMTLVGRANRLAYTASSTLAAGTGLVTPWLTVDGYSKFTVCLYSNAVDNYYRLACSHVGGPVFYVDTRSDIGSDLVETYDAPNERIQLYFFNFDAGSRTVNVEIYSCHKQQLLPLSSFSALSRHVQRFHQYLSFTTVLPHLFLFDVRTRRWLIAQNAGNR
jgi:hypothetical protein